MDDRQMRPDRPGAAAPHRPAARPPPIEVRRLNKRYKGGPQANQDVSLTVAWGEALGVVGPNGAGKTTLVRQITTELVPTSGTVWVLGIDAVRHPDQVKARIGVVPQEARLFDQLSASQHLRIFGQLRGLSRRGARRRADELLQQLDLQRYRRTASAKLSGGLRRRLLIGIALLAEPDLLILDEPTVGLDVESRRQLWAVIRDYRRRGAAILLTTHYMEEAEALCDRIAVIQDGRLTSIDTVENLRASIGHQFKLTYQTRGRRRTLYGNDEAALAARVRAAGVDEYTVTRTTLEDVYLTLTKDTQQRSGGDGAD